MKKLLVIVGIAIVALATSGGGYYGWKKLRSEPTDNKTITAQANTEPAQPEAAKRAGEYAAYDVAKLAQATDGKVILFFNARWSKTCKMLDAELKANTAKLPNNFTILSVDYDKNSALRKKYQVPFEDTFVQVDAAGTMVNRWSGSEDMNEIISLAK